MNQKTYKRCNNNCQSSNSSKSLINSYFNSISQVMIDIILSQYISYICYNLNLYLSIHLSLSENSIYIRYNESIVVYVDDLSVSVLPTETETSHQTVSYNPINDYPEKHRTYKYKLEILTLSFHCEPIPKSKLF